MSIPDLAEKWTGTVSTVTLGATAEGGGTRTSTVKLGGAKALPFVTCDGDVGNRPAIALEIWDMPLEHYGSFVSLIPAPLGIGTLELADGSSVQGFLCEALATAGAQDISRFGGWRAYIASQQQQQQ